MDTLFVGSQSTAQSVFFPFSHSISLYRLTEYYHNHRNQQRLTFVYGSTNRFRLVSFGFGYCISQPPRDMKPNEVCVFAFVSFRGAPKFMSTCVHACNCVIGLSRQTCVCPPCIVQSVFDICDREREKQTDIAHISTSDTSTHIYMLKADTSDHLLCTQTLFCFAHNSLYIVKRRANTESEEEEKNGFSVLLNFPDRIATLQH